MKHLLARPESKQCLQSLATEDRLWPLFYRPTSNCEYRNHMLIPAYPIVLNYRINDGMFCFAHLQSCHNGWACNILSGGCRPCKTKHPIIYSLITNQPLIPYYLFLAGKVRLTWAQNIDTNPLCILDLSTLHIPAYFQVSYMHLLFKARLFDEYGWPDMMKHSANKTTGKIIEGMAPRKIVHLLKK